MTLAAGAPEERLTLDAKGKVLLLTDASVGVASTPDERICPGSIRTARQHDASLAAAWWTVRNDSSVVLLAAVSRDGGATWSVPVPIDTADVGRAGCARPPLSIATSGGFVHVAYSLRGREGTGVFYAHSMTRGRSYEPPTPIVYGDRLTAAAVSADAGVVAVAFEDPNGRNPQIGLAISKDWGHIFGDRIRGSTGVGPAAMPQVAVAGLQIAVAWQQRSRGADVASRATRIVRVGRLS